MISWCAYCQRYQGEVPPYKNFSISHGLCATCEKLEVMESAEAGERVRFLAELYRKFWRAGKEGDHDAAENLIQEGCLHGVRPIDLLFGFAGPALIKVGELWESGVLTVEDEHRFTGVCDGFTNKIFELISGTSAVLTSAVRKKIMLTHLPGNEHQLGLRFARIGLMSNQMDVTLQARDAPLEKIVEAALSEPYDAVGFSISMASQLPELKKAIEFLRRESAFKGKIWVGGALINECKALTLDLDILPVERPRFDEDELKRLF